MNIQEAKEFITEAKNIYILPSKENQGEITACSLALFYSLRKLNKNVNLLIEEIPENLQFLTPSLNFISYPKEVAVSIPNSAAKISQLRYEKNDESLKIYLTLENGNVNKNDISFNFTNPKPDLFITVGIKNFDHLKKSHQEEVKIQPDSTILNIDNQVENKNFGRINLVKQKSSLTEIIIELIKSVDNNLFDKDVATCLLAGIIIWSENFRNQKTSNETFEQASFLIKNGAQRQQIIDSLYKPKSLSQTKFLSRIFQNLNFEPKKEVNFAVLDTQDFQNLSDFEIGNTITQLKSNFLELSNLLVLWKSHASGPVIKGFFYSEKPDLIKKIAESFQGNIKNNDITFSVEGSDLNIIKERVLQTLIS